MIGRIEISGLGPHRRFSAELSPLGATTLAGPSEIGKTTLLEAVLFALLGKGVGGRFRTEAIHDDAEKAEVRLTLASGLIIERTIDRERSITRALISGDEPEAFRTERGFARAVGRVAQDPELTRLIITPLAWTELAATNARPLRDLLARLLPSPDTAARVRAEMIARGGTITAEEAIWTERQASNARRDARRARDKAQGSLGALEAQRDRLAAPPEPDTGPSLAALRAEEAAASQALADVADAWRQARDRRDQLQSQLSAGACPTCKRGWDDAPDPGPLRTALAAAVVDLDAAAGAGTAARQTHDAARERLGQRMAREGGRAQRAADLAQLDVDLRDACASVSAAELEAERLDALLGIIRKTPSLLAAEQAAALQPLGPVSLEFGENPAVTVLIDGRPWWLASRGRQVVADVHLRQALRRVSGLQQLPLVIDNVQDVGGQELPVPEGPAILLRTTDDPQLTVLR